MRPFLRCSPFVLALTACITLSQSAHGQRITPAGVREGDKAVVDRSAVTGAAAGGVLGATVGGLGVILGYISGAGLGAGLASSVC
jgi:hypothetical protein